METKISIILFRCICGFILIPFFYLRYSFFIFLPILFTKLPCIVFFVFWAIYVIVIGFIMSNCGVMKYWTKLIVVIFKVEYLLDSPILTVRNKQYKMRVSRSALSSGYYDDDDDARRKAIFHWLFNHRHHTN